jgi:hypothetical protein
LIAHFGEQTKLPEAAGFTIKPVSGGRSAGEIDDSAHYRSGLPGSWRRELPDSIRAYICAHFCRLLECYYPESFG